MFADRMQREIYGANRKEQEAVKNCTKESKMGRACGTYRTEEKFVPGF